MELSQDPADEVGANCPTLGFSGTRGGHRRWGFSAWHSLEGAASLQDGCFSEAFCIKHLLHVRAWAAACVCGGVLIAK